MASVLKSTQESVNIIDLGRTALFDLEAATNDGTTASNFLSQDHKAGRQHTFSYDPLHLIPSSEAEA
jgi:hypothetical protein